MPRTRPYKCGQCPYFTKKDKKHGYCKPRQKYVDRIDTACNEMKGKYND